MLRLIGLLILFFISTVHYGQTETCNCPENLAKTIQKTEENYAGFPAKVNPATTVSYKQLKNTLRTKAKSASRPKKCFAVIAEYVRFFKDKHFIFSYFNESDFDSTVITYNKNYFKTGIPGKSLHPAEGVYTNAEGTVKIAVVKGENKSFKGIKLESANDKLPKGFVYFTLTPHGNDFFVKEYKYFSSTKYPAKLVGNLLQFWDNTLGKIYPQQMNAEEKTELDSWKNYNRGLSFRKVGKDISWLKINTFMSNDDKIQQLVNANDSVIRHSKYLIIDLRGNEGGGTGWIHFLPYIMTDTIVQDKSLLRVTPGNVKIKLADFEAFAKNPLPDDYKKYFPEYILKEFKKAYAELPVTNEPFYPLPSPIIPLEYTGKYPEKVALLVDNFCGSSSEYFFYITKQSRKTVSYGENTVGMMDYEGMGIPTVLPYNKFSLMIPIAKSAWTDTKPIDQTGFKPDKIINLPQEKWVEYVIEDLKKNN